MPALGDGEIRVLATTLDDMRRHLQEVLESLAMERSRYHGIIESMSHAVYTTDGDMRIRARAVGSPA